MMLIRDILLYVCILYSCRVVFASPVPVGSDSNSTESFCGGKTELSCLKDLVYQMKHQLENVTKGKAELEKRLEELEKRHFSQSDFSPAARTVFPDVVGFSVELDSTIHDLPVGSTVIFDGVWYNAGNGYDKTTGIFTCPLSGVYLFAIFVESYNTDEAYFRLYIDGSYRVGAVSERVEDGHDSTGGNVLVEHIQKGQRVWVETLQFDNQDLYRHFTTFSGVLIQST